MRQLVIAMSEPTTMNAPPKMTWLRGSTAPAIMTRIIETLPTMTSADGLVAALERSCGVCVTTEMLYARFHAWNVQARGNRGVEIGGRSVRVGHSERGTSARPTNPTTIQGCGRGEWTSTPGRTRAAEDRRVIAVAFDGRRPCLPLSFC
mgnify:CR=1 FL=1